VDHPDNAEVAKENALKALEQMASRNIPSTPQNFTIWYTYLTGRHPDLINMIDKMIAEDAVFDNHHNAEIFERFFGYSEEGARIQAASEQIGTSAMEMSVTLAEVSDGTQSYSESLEQKIDDIRGAESTDELATIADSLANDTNRMLAHSRSLEERLHLTTSEIETLRRNLEEIRREAMTDALTGIANRKYFDIHLRTAVLHSMENHTPLTLMLADIDHFKKFNDNYGHQTGDDVLRLVAHTLASTVKESDTAARYGGEEFAIILPNTNLRGSRGLGEKIRESVGSKRFRKKQTGEELSQITISIGIAEYRAGEALVDLIQRADDGLYHAKRTGRNKVVDETETAGGAIN
jgi:diguanylate cyclase